MSSPRSPLDEATLSRWRLVLGSDATGDLLGAGGGEAEARMASVLDFLFDPARPAPPAPPAAGAPSPKTTRKKAKGTASAQPPQPAPVASTGAGSSPSVLTVPTWVESVRELFPVPAREVLERELVRRRGLSQLLEDPRLLDRVEPSLDLVKLVLAHRSLLGPQAREAARRLIAAVVDQLAHLFRRHVERAITGALRRDRRSARHVLRNLDLRRTIWQNLRGYDAERGRLVIDHLCFFEAERRRRPWHVIVVVDQSGSMLAAAVYAAVMASIFAALPSIKTSLVLFDTQIVDLSGLVASPVDVLLSVQLGGGTDIAGAMRYAEQLVTQPRRAIVVLITDFEEGGPTERLVAVTERMAASGVTLFGLAALGYDGAVMFNRLKAAAVARVGMTVLAATPEQLADSIAAVMQGKCNS